MEAGGGVLPSLCFTLQARTQVVEKVGYILVGTGKSESHALPGKFWISRHSEIVSNAILSNKSLQTLTILD